MLLLFYQVQIGDLEAWEKMYGRIPDNAYVFAKTGYSKYYVRNDLDKYLGSTDHENAESYNFPGFSPEAVEWMCKNRKISAIGVESPSPDHGSTGAANDFPVHRYTVHLVCVCVRARACVCDWGRIILARSWQHMTFLYTGILYI